MLDAFELGRSEQLFDLWAYVIMPEHVHTVIYPRDGIRIQQILKTLKQSVSVRASRWLEHNAPRFKQQLMFADGSGHQVFRFWQRGGGYDRNLRSANDVHEKIHYIHANPVRRGLVTHPRDWQWSSCLAWESGGSEPLAIDRDTVPRLHV